MRPEVLCRDGTADREELAACDALLERSRDLVRVELLALEVALHQALVDLHDLVEELLAIFLGESRHRVGDRDGVGLLLAARRHVRAHVQHVDDALELVLRADRDVHGDAFRRELLLDLTERAEEVGPLTVEHVHDEEAREAEVLRELLHACGPDLEAHHAGDDDERALDDAERAARLTLERRVARAVDEVELPVLPARVGERQRDRQLALLLVLVRVGDGRAGLD